MTRCMMGKGKEALEDAEAAIKIDNNWAKVLTITLPFVK